MRDGWKLYDKRCFGLDFVSDPDDVHVLVERLLPPRDLTRPSSSCLERSSSMKKRQRLSRAFGLKELWAMTNPQLTQLPRKEQLAAFLDRSLPFMLELVDKELEQDLFDQNAPLVDCDRIANRLIAYCSMCSDGVDSDASKKTWGVVYSSLLHITLDMCSGGNEIHIESFRDVMDETGTTNEKYCPGNIVHTENLVLLRGEEKDIKENIEDSCAELTSKMREWNPLFYGELPYILGYATSGERLHLVAIDHKRRVQTILRLRSVIGNKSKAIRAFFNLAFIFDKMITVSKRKYSTPQLWKPYTNSVNTCTMQLEHNWIKRTIVRAKNVGKSDFTRLVDIYREMWKMKSRNGGRTHLQRLRAEPVVVGRTLIVDLSPIGFERHPENVEEVREWVRGMLTALTYWHERGYCHGDVQWENIVYNPMDESLRFQHDLFQLGELFDDFDDHFLLTDELAAIRGVLQASLRTSECTAASVLDTLNDPNTLV
ncbi:hypothetical protein PC129_g12412 [Phytophthora cactorum]|uniref:Protein kinase-like domain n=1 Tax=Phytophthora cactorum TaxID=29920 RepID=A0A329T194_9STRA|nr:hypothetical protein Pcac1_g2978 [Phytophthora cactorum]KAG2821428.1 hypothetical protein PC111_g11020 [Phytophthora cactorum]KAG2840275.1 hypothetical protein PC112_g3811 [Phytophthora cactorum]KAG2861878.1 hypothetical protein PC113_g6794 [Phytophthora cactorum]KAG2901412.1 hypothetical protein PC114_g13180 [Phytophthora cactorum]